jgi:monovalent cation/hydrogen antiporter
VLGAAVAVTVIAVRMLWVFPATYIPRWIVPGLAKRDPVPPTGAIIVLGWAGMRGAVSLAAALALPTHFPERDLLIYLTFVTILVTLVGQGLTLPALLRALGIRGERPWSPDEAIARLEAAQAALDRIDELEDEGAAEEVLRRLRELYRARFRACQAVLGGEGDGRPPEDPRLHRYASLRRDLITVERDTLLRMRNAGELRNEVLRNIEHDLDLDEARLRT